MELKNEELEILHFFCFRLLHDYKTGRFNVPNFKFVFTDDDYSKIIKYLESLKDARRAIRIEIKTNFCERTVMASEIEETINLIKEIHEEFKENRDESVNYIMIPDYKEFFELLNELMETFEENPGSNNFNATALLRSLFLRMGPSDLEDVISFIKRQISFTKNDYLIPTFENELAKVNELYIGYFNRGNQDFFETNRHIQPVIKRKYGEMQGILPNERTSQYKYYYLPVIHYGLIKENDIPTCYVYGIQQLNRYKNDEVIKNMIQEERKRLRNEHISADFLISLQIFINILKNKGITTIKVPLLQIYNYEYHQNIGNKYNERLSRYSPEQIHDLEWMNASDRAIEEYENIKRQVKRFYDKEDIISANKTERLVYAFYLVAEYYGDIEIITEPFIESDHLICKINYQKEKKILPK